MLAYLRLLIKDRLLALGPGASAGKGSGKVKSAFAVFGFAVLALVLYGMVVALEYFVFQGFVVIGQAGGALAVAFLLCVFITLFLSFYMVFNTLFFSKDIELVSALPISSRGLLADKLILIALGEAVSALLLCLPVVILYGIHTGAGFLYYLKAVLFTPFLPMIAMALVALLSFVLIRISALWKRREGVTTVVTILFVGLIVAFQMSLSMNAGIEEDLGKIIVAVVMKQGVLVDWFVRAFPPIGWLCNALIQTGGAAWANGVLFAAVSSGAVLLVVMVLGGKYQRLAIKQSEAVARLNAHGKKRKQGVGVHSPLGALYLREMKEIITVPAYATNCLGSLIMFPIMTVAVMMSMREYSGGLSAADWLMGSLSPRVFFLIFLALFCFTCFMNIAVATAVSREGKRRYFSKIIPVPAGTQLLAKLYMGMSVNLAAMLLTAITLCVFLPSLWMQIVLAVAAALPFALLSCALGLLLDVHFPRLGWKTETEAVKRNFNGMYGMFGTMALEGLMVAAFFGLMALGLGQILSILLILFLLCVIDVVLVKWLVGKASRVYLLKEKFG